MELEHYHDSILILKNMENYYNFFTIVRQQEVNCM